MRAKTANAQNLLPASKTHHFGSSSKPQAGAEPNKGSATYSLKILVHKLSLDNDVARELGTRNTVELGFAVKLLEYPTIQITDLVKTTKDQLFSKQGQPRFLDLKIGKSWVFVSDKSTLMPQIDSGHATISVITLAGKELGMAKLALQSFKRFLEQPQQEDNYRRKTFNLYSNQSEHQTGQIEISLSFTCINEDKMDGARASRLLAVQKPKSFFDESNGSSFVGVSAPQVREHLTASMLSRNDFADELVGASVERSAVEAILESKKSKNFFDESEDKSKKSPARPTVKLAMKPQTQPAPSILELAASASMKSTYKPKESKQKSQTSFGSKQVVPPEAARVEMADGAPSVLRPFDTPIYQNLGEQLKQLSKMPGIHEMATQSMYCPPPLYYQKDKSLTQGYITAEGFGDRFQFGVTPDSEQPKKEKSSALQQNFFLRPDEPAEIPQVLRPTIVLNEKATRSLLSETDLQLALGQNSLLDIVLAELIRLRSQSVQKSTPLQPTSSVAGANPSPLVRVMLENPQALLGALHRSASGSEYQGSGVVQNNGGASPKQSSNKKPQNNSGFKNAAIPIGTNESLKDSIFQQSQSKKADRRRDLEKIEEHANSKYYEDEFDAIRDDVQMSLSISQTGPYPQGIKQSNQKGNPAYNKKATFDDGSHKLMPESGQGDIESQSGIIDALRASESAGALGTRRKESSVTAPREQETGPTIPCVFCKKTILVKDISDHFQSCLKPDLKSKLDTKKQESKTQNQKAPPGAQSNRKIAKNGGAASPNMKASAEPNPNPSTRYSASYDPYAGSFGDGGDLHVSASKSSMLRKSDKEMIQRSESRVKTDYDDEFIDPGTERSEIPDF